MTVPGGAICSHCGFELEEPEEGAVLAFRKAARRADDWPEAGGLTAEGGIHA